jgi:hypothetical protein
MLAGCGQILKKMKRSFSRQTSVPDFCKSFSGPHVSPSVLLDIADDDPDDMFAVQ